MNKSLQILFIASDTKACGFYRSIKPAMALQQNSYFDIQNVYIFVKKMPTDIDLYRGIDIVVIQRWGDVEAWKYMGDLYNFQKELGFKIVLDLDDNMLDPFPKYNKFASMDYKQEILEFHPQILQYVDAITVPTENLKQRYEKHGCKNVYIFENYLSKWDWKNSLTLKSQWLKPRVKTKYDLSIIWPGSANHFYNCRVDIKNDLGDWKEIESVVRNGKYYWYFSPYMPADFEWFSNCRNLAYKPFDEYPEMMSNLQGDLIIAPLQENDFNLYKSNIKYKEAIVSGFPFVAKNWGPYSDCLYTYNNDDELDRLLQLFKDDDFRRKAWERDYEKIKDNLWLEDNIYKLLHIFREITE